MSLSPTQFDYILPDELIAQQPVTPRDASRLMLVDRASNQLSDHTFRQLPKLLKPGDVLVRNNTKVLPARIVGQKTTGGKLEILLNKRVAITPEGEIWQCLTKPGLKTSQRVLFGPLGSQNQPPILEAECVRISDYERIIQFNKSGEEFFQALDQAGQTPIPPYIGWDPADEPKLRETYQTTFAKHRGSAAAPTAGLHFTPELDTALGAAGIQILEVTLHVGLGTFLPVTSQHLESHKLHSERLELTPEVATQLNTFKANGQRLISVGTTSTRVLESCFNRETQLFEPKADDTEIFIYPPYEFQAIDGLITNFHLPKSSLLMLVSALVSHPNTPAHFTDFDHTLVGQAYQEAIQSGYRFYSFGDAMLIL